MPEGSFFRRSSPIIAPLFVGDYHNFFPFFRNHIPFSDFGLNSAITGETRNVTLEIRGTRLKNPEFRLGLIATHTRFTI